MERYMNRLKYCYIVLMALLVAVSAAGQGGVDRLFFRDGSEKAMDIWKEADGWIYGFYPGDADLQKVEKQQLRKIVYRDGREITLVAESTVGKSVEKRTVKPKKKTDPNAPFFHPGSVQVGIGAGLPFSGLKSYKIVPLWLAVEAGVVRLGKPGVLSLGASADYSKMALGANVGYNAEITQFSVEALAGVHFFLTPRIALHGHAGAGFRQSNSTVKTSSSATAGKTTNNGLSASALAGVSVYALKNLALSVEGGYWNGATARLGIILNL